MALDHISRPDLPDPNHPKKFGPFVGVPFDRTRPATPQRVSVPSVARAPSRLFALLAAHALPLATLLGLLAIAAAIYLRPVAGRYVSKFESDASSATVHVFDTATGDDYSETLWMSGEAKVIRLLRNSRTGKTTTLGEK